MHVVYWVSKHPNNLQTVKKIPKKDKELESETLVCRFYFIELTTDNIKKIMGLYKSASFLCQTLQYIGKVLSFELNDFVSEIFTRNSPKLLTYS